MKIAIIGEKKLVLAFTALGVKTFGVASQEDLLLAEKEIMADQFAIIFITEDIAEKYSKEIVPFYNKTLPAVLIIPGVKSSGIASGELKKIIERALGSDNLAFNN